MAAALGLIGIFFSFPVMTKMQKLPLSPIVKCAGTSVIDEEDTMVIDLCSSPSPRSELKGTPLRPVFCLKNRDNIKRIEEREDCFILDFDPGEDDDLTLSVSSKNNVENVDGVSPDVSLVGEKGKVLFFFLKTFSLLPTLIPALVSATIWH